MALVEVKVPDIGDFKDVAVIELLVKPGDTVKAEQSLITVESDKASMEIPSSHAGVVKDLKVKLGDKVREGSVILTLEAANVASTPAPPPQPSPSGGGSASVVQVGDAHIQRILAQRSRDVTQNRLDSDHALRPAEAAKRRVALHIRLAAVAADDHVAQEISVVGVEDGAVAHRAAQIR